MPLYFEELQPDEHVKFLNKKETLWGASENLRGISQTLGFNWIG